MKTKKIPMRMCIACHEMKPKKEMLRIVKPKEGDVFIDFSGKAAGRGAYICNDPECIRKLKKSRLLKQAFSVYIPLAVDDAKKEAFFAKKLRGSVRRPVQ